MKKNYVIIAVSVILGVFLVWLFYPLTENQKIEMTLNAAVQAFENKNSKEVLSYATDNLQLHGVGDKEEAIMHMKGFFFKVKELKASIEHLQHENTKLPKDAKEARVIIVVKVSGSIDGSKFQSFGNSGADALTLTMKKIKGEWKVASVKYLNTKDPLKALQELKFD